MQIYLQSLRSFPFERNLRLVRQRAERSPRGRSAEGLGCFHRPDIRPLPRTPHLLAGVEKAIRGVSAVIHA